MLRAEKLCKAFGALQVTKNVSLEIPQGARHAIIGPNGAGKTTLFNLLAGELAPDAGAILIDDRDITHLPPNRRARLGLARSFQKNNLFPRGSVRDNLLLADIAARGYGYRFWSRLSARKDAYRKAATIAAQIGLTEELARAVAEPKVLLLDEPTSGMSPEETARMLRLIDDLPRSLTVVMIEHDMDLVFAHADRITVLDYGEVLMEGRPEEVRGSDVVQETYLGGERD